MLRLQLFGRFRVEDDQGAEIEIKSRKARALLAYLALPIGKPRSRDAVAALLWSDRGDEQARGSLRQALSGLRRELGHEAIEALVVSDDYLALDPNRVELASPAPGDELLDGLGVNDPAFDEWLRDERSRLENQLRVERKHEASKELGKPAVAVLPFANMSGDPEQAYFSDGITEDLITELGRFTSLEVVARNSTFVYRNEPVDVVVLGAALGADFLLEGSVRKAANRVRLTAQLINVETGKQVWADRYDRELLDIFAIQDELVHAIVTRLADRLTSLETVRSIKKPPESLEAYDYYLRALSLDRTYTAAGSREAAALLRKAIELEPSFARAHALLSAQIWTERRLEGDLNEKHLRAAVEAGRKAVELDPGDSSCHALLAIAYLQSREYEQSGYHLDLAMALNPHDSFIWSDRAWHLCAIGRHEEALDLLTQREQVEPVPPLWHWFVRGRTLYSLGRWREAIAAFERVRSGDSFPIYGAAYLAACHGQLNDSQRAKEYWALFTQRLPNAKAETILGIVLSAVKSDANLWLDGLKKAGIE